jgi:hypothetical protein
MLNWIFYSIEIVKRKGIRLTFGVPVDDFEVEPLSVALGINIIFKPKVIFDIIHFNSSSQIAVFKPAIENKHIFLLWDVNSVCVSWLSSHERIVIV